jgi:putative PEP-CTERM system TPR-repeat lipoprotein
MKHRNRLVALLIALAAVLQPALAAPQEEAARYYEDALARFQQGNMAAAIVQLKNALQQDPGMLAARVLLGKAHLRQGEPAAAEEAFLKALQLGVDRSEVVVPLAQALRDQARPKELLDNHSPEGLPLAQKVDLLVLRGQAYRSLRDVKSAEAALKEAQRLDPRHVPALLAHAELALQMGNRTEANALVDRALGVAPNDVTAWNLQATIAQASGDSANALSAFSKALSIEARSIEARIGRLSLLLNLNRDAEAVADIEYLKIEHPKEPRGIYLQAVYLSRNGDNAGARDALERVTVILDPLPKSLLKQQAPQFLLIGGLAHYGLAQWEQARGYLEEYLKLDPGHPGARKLLGVIYLTQGNPRLAIDTLEPVRRRTPSDPQVLALLATAHMARKQYGLATEYLNKALESGGEDASVNATLGFSLLGLGQRDLAMEQLRRAFARDPGRFQAGAALAVLYLREGHTAEAVKVAEAVVKRDPQNVAALNLLGVARAAANDRKGARAAYLKAIAADKNFSPSQLNLGKLELQEGNHAAARDRFLAILKTRPKDTQPMYEMAVVEQSAGNQIEAVRWLEKAHAIDRAHTGVTIQLVELYIIQRKFEAALTAAKETQEVVPSDLLALAALGRAYVAMGNLERARELFDRMTALANFGANWQYRIAVLQLSATNTAGAVDALERALSIEPNHLDAAALLTGIELQTGALAKAEERARAILKRNPDSAIGRRLIADVAMARKNFPEAIKAYSEALAKEASSDNAIRLFQAYMQSGSMAKASEHLEAWLRNHPNDLAALNALAEGQLQAGNLAAARSSYERLLKLGGEQSSVLNNLANIHIKQGDAKAVAYAEKAFALAPTDPAVQDTLGWALVQQGQLDKGLRNLREARLRDPQNLEIRYHVASALSRAGRTDEARAELEPVITGNADFEGSEEARSLWQQLSTH